MSINYSQPAFWHEKPEAWQEIMSGVKRRMLSHAATGLMVLYKIEAGKTFAWHNHPHAQFGVFLEGGGKFRVGEAVWEMKAGDSYYIPPAVFHELKTSEHCVILDFFTPVREDYVREALPPDTT